MQERELLPGRHHEQPVGLRRALATLARCFVVATPTVIGSPTSSRTRARSRSAIRRGVPAKCSIPRTSRNASSIEMPSTTGDMSSKTAKTALLASEYASIRGGTTTASGHSRSAAAAHRAGDAIRLRLVARGEDDPAADDHRPAAQPRVVALLDRREEGVEVGVEDRGFT